VKAAGYFYLKANEICIPAGGGGGAKKEKNLFEFKQF